MSDYDNALKDSYCYDSLLSGFRREDNEAVDTTARLIAKLAEKAAKEFR